MAELATGESLLDRGKRRRKELGLNVSDEEVTATPAAQWTVQWDDDLIPQVSLPERSPEDDDITRLVESLDLVDAYRRWCGKMEPKVGSKRESIMVSCPSPSHPDKNPSAWINLDKGTWFCGGCQEGGDAYDLAAWHFGYPVPNYKTNGSFPELRRQIAEDLGYVIKRTPAGAEYVESKQEPTTSAPPPSVEAEAVANPDEMGTESGSVPVLSLVPQSQAGESAEPPSIDWRSIVPHSTFLYRWLTMTSEDDLPEEYYFWLGLMACGFAAGHDVVLLDRPPVKGNLFICLYGPSGIGKTRATHALTELLDRALPYDHSDVASTGTQLMPTPGSAEALIDSFSKPIHDPSSNEVIGYSPVRGLVRFDELSNLIGKANRSGSVLKPTMMELYDGYRAIELKSRGAGYVRAEGHFCSAVTTTQPGAIRELLMQSDADSGFINRWVFAAGPLKKLIDYGREPLNVTALVDDLRELRQWSCRGHQLTLEGQAREVWRDFFDTNIAPARTSDEQSLLTRADLLLKKVIALFCVNEMKDQPDEDLVQRVVSLFPFLQQTYAMLISEIGIGIFEDCRATVGKLIRNAEERSGRAVAIREINRLMSRRYSRDLLTKVLRVMVELGELNEYVEKPARGPATVRYGYTG